jgi:adenylylsulfate kinase-like enzyme
MFIPQSPQGPQFIVFSGIPGSGKTTEALKLIDRLRSEGRQALKVNRDDLRSMLFGEAYHTGDFPSVHEQDVTTLQRKLLHHGLERRWTVISDDTNLSASGVKSFKRIADQHSAEFFETGSVEPRVAVSSPRRSSARCSSVRPTRSGPREVSDGSGSERLHRS